MGNANKKSKTENHNDTQPVKKEKTNNEETNNNMQHQVHKTNLMKQKKKSTPPVKKEKTNYEVADVFRLGTVVDFISNLSDDSKSMLDLLWDNSRDLQQFTLSQLSNLRRYKSSDEVVGVLTSVINTLDNHRAAFQRY